MYKRQKEGSDAAFFLLFFLLIAFSVFFGGSGDPGGNVFNANFRQTKAWLEDVIYHDHRETMYCAIPFTARKRLLLPTGFAADAGWRPARMTWEHAVPLEHFGRAFEEWRTGHPVCVRRDGTRYRGRECAHRASREFRLMEADMYNLFPAVDAVNSARGNRDYADLPEVVPVSGACPAGSDRRVFVANVVHQQPRPQLLVPTRLLPQLRPQLRHLGPERACCARRVCHG